MYRDFILLREEKGGSTASQKATSIAAVGLFVCEGKGAVTIVWVLDSSSFQNGRRRAGGIYNLIISSCLYRVNLTTHHLHFLSILCYGHFLMSSSISATKETGRNE